MLRFALPLTLATMIALPVSAQTLSPVKTAELSGQLYAVGLEIGDPLMILSAAKLRKQLGLKPVERMAEDATPEDGSPISWEEMLASAEDIADENPVLLGLIADVRAESNKGAATGPVYSIAKIRNGGTDKYGAVEFVGGDYAEVYVEAKSSTDLNLRIYDAQGRLVCSDTDASHIAYCGWRPSATEGFVLHVENKGPQGASYALMTN